MIPAATTGQEPFPGWAGSCESQGIAERRTRISFPFGSRREPGTRPSLDAPASPTPFQPPVPVQAQLPQRWRPGRDLGKTGNQRSAAHTSLRNSSAKGISFHNFPGTILPVLLIFKQTRKPTKGIFQESPRINPLHPRLSTGLLGFAQMCYTM